MKNDEVERIRSFLDSVQYKPDLFSVGFGEDKVIFGALFKDQPELQRFFSYATIYDSILDVDKKIKLSIIEATRWTDDIPFDEWHPLENPSNNEWRALYYTENAAFRVEVLWDLMAQLFNLKENLGKPYDKIYAEQLFHDNQQGKKPNLFAKKVYDYMKQEDDFEVDPWRGNYSYIKGFRDKLTHRNSPNISCVSDYATELRMPAIYILYRLTEDYMQVSRFIQEILSEITKDVEDMS